MLCVNLSPSVWILQKSYGVHNQFLNTLSILVYGDMKITCWMMKWGIQCWASALKTATSSGKQLSWATEGEKKTSCSHLVTTYSLKSSLLYFCLQHHSLRFFSQNHGIVEVGGDLMRSCSPTPALLKAGSTTAGCPVLCPARFLISLRMETLQPAWETRSSIWPPSW